MPSRHGSEDANERLVKRRRDRRDSSLAAVSRMVVYCSVVIDAYIQCKQSA